MVIGRWSPLMEVLMRGFDYEFDAEFELNGIPYYVVGSAAIECEEDGSNPVIEEMTFEANDMGEGDASFEAQSLRSGQFFAAVMQAIENSPYYAERIRNLCVD